MGEDCPRVGFVRERAYPTTEKGWLGSFFRDNFASDGTAIATAFSSSKVGFPSPTIETDDYVGTLGFFWRPG